MRPLFRPKSNLSMAAADADGRGPPLLCGGSTECRRSASGQRRQLREGLREKRFWMGESFSVPRMWEKTPHSILCASKNKCKHKLSIHQNSGYLNGLPKRFFTIPTFVTTALYYISKDMLKKCRCISLHQFGWMNACDKKVIFLC